jgi:hypothetical protein
MSNSIYELCEKYLNPEEEKNNGWREKEV